MENMYLTEAFQALEKLNLRENTFEVTDDGIKEANDFLNYDFDDEEQIIDPLAETEDELEDSYIGKAILDCVICHSKIYEDPENIKIDEEKEVVNIEDICPYCQSNDGYKIIGQVAKYCPNCQQDEVISTDVLEEADKSAAISIEDAQRWIDYDMKRYGKISNKTNKLIKKAGFQIIKDQYGDYEVTAGKFESMKDTKKKHNIKSTASLKSAEALDEDIEKVEVETTTDKITTIQDENGKVVISTEPKEIIEDEEIIAPISSEMKDIIEAENEAENEDDYKDDYKEVDFTEFEEEDFDKLGEKYLRRVYENVRSFKTTKGSLNENKLKLEGIISFKSGKQAKTAFIFEAHTVSKTGKLKFLGENKELAKGKKVFTLTGTNKNGKLRLESLTYNYKAKDSKTNTSTKLYGTVRK